MVHDAATRLGAVDEHDLLEFVVRGSEVSHALIELDGGVVECGFEMIGHIVAPKLRHREIGSKDGGTVERQCLHALHILNDHQAILMLKASADDAVIGNVPNGVAHLEVVGRDADEFVAAFTQYLGCRPFEVILVLQSAEYLDVPESARITLLLTTQESDFHITGLHGHVPALDHGCHVDLGRTSMEVPAAVGKELPMRAIG